MEEVPLLKRLAAKYSRRARIIGIAIDEDVAKVDRTVKEKQMTWPIVADRRGFDAPIPTAYHVEGTPDIFVLDAAGRIVKRLDSAKEIETILDGLAAPRR
jgi:hypothetical protein